MPLNLDNLECKRSVRILYTSLLDTRSDYRDTRQ